MIYLQSCILLPSARIYFSIFYHIMINFIHFQVDLSFVCILGSRFSLIALFLFLCFVFNLLWEYPELVT